MNDTFLTIKAPSEGEFKDKGSKFLAYAFSVSSVEEVKQQLDFLHELHPKAVHHCYAYRFGFEHEHFRANDDGEPSGSAGKPILNAIQSRQLSNILIVVVRYFGGTLLGVPGLINAYKSASLEAIDSAEIIEKVVVIEHEISFEFEQMNAVMKIMKTHSLKILEQGFSLGEEVNSPHIFRIF
jgi:uncharacterized YigZ family protein